LDITSTGLIAAFSQASRATAALSREM